ncbi:cytochrome P450 [Kitasatospora sp. NPDC049285]|uniref:cytochrome P450 n=1 Tax=Kitasatospora sp. NPDC049285 TaxID=3157096 RepID=UPI0034232752
MKLLAKSAVARSGVVPLAPGGLPLVGHLIPLARRRLDYLLELRGLGDLVRIRVGSSDFYVVNSPQLLNQVLVTRADSFDRGRVFAKARAFAGYGIATSDGAYHLKQRRMMMPAFHVARLREYAEAMVEESTRLTGRWQAGQRVDLDRAMHRLLCAITARTLFRQGLSEEAAAEVSKHLDTLLKGVLWHTIAPDLLGSLPTPGNRRFDRAGTELRELVTDFVQAYLADPTDRGDLLSMLVAARDDGTDQGMTSEQLLDEVLTIFFSGMETSATTLSWLFHELGRNPELYERLTDEVDSVLQGRNAGFDELPQLVFTRRLVTEALRLYTPPWILMRTSNTEVDLGGAQLPAGTNLVYSLTAMHRDPALYAQPDRFDPDRWADPELKAPYMPFGGGRHKCIGDHFAMTEMVIVVATIVARWRLVPVPGVEVREIAHGTLRPSSLPMTVQPRS